jgi:diamine N-acetyltransferase
MRHSLAIRTGGLEDADCLAVLATQVWLHTYATDGISDEISKYVLSELTPAKFIEFMQAPSRCIFVAAQGENLVGLAVVKCDAPCPADGNPSTAELQTLYVQEYFIGKGIGASLLRAAESWARERAGCSLWLTVNARNSRAISFYLRHAYAKIGTAYFVLGTGRYENHVLVGPDA